MTEQAQTTDETIANAFKAVAIEMTSKGTTLNGDINYATLSTKLDTPNLIKFAETLLEFGQKLVLVPSNIKKKKIGPKQKGQAKSKYDFFTYSAQWINDKYIQNIITLINKASIDEQQIMYDMFIRFIFRERAITGNSRAIEGKGHRNYSYLLFTYLFDIMPNTAKELLPLFPHYGSFQDYNMLIGHFMSIHKMDIVNIIADIFVKAINADLQIMINQNLLESDNPYIDSIINDKINDLHKTISGMTPEQIKETYPNIKISLAGKWFPRPDSNYGKKRREAREAHNLIPEGTHMKQFSKHRDILIARLFFSKKNGYEYWTTLPDKTKSFYQRLMRHILSCCNMFLNVPETRMSKNQWNMLEPSKMPAGAINKHRIALLNRVIGSSAIRTDNPDRIELSERMIDTAVKGELNGATLDSVKFAKQIFPKSSLRIIEDYERTILHSQFMNLVEDIRKRVDEDYTKAIDKWMEDGPNPETKPVDPLDVIATIDVSGSMAQADVMGSAIVLGIIITLLSKLGRNFITFSDNPQLIHLREDGDIVDWIEQVSKSNWGGSTNMDGALELLLGLMHKVRIQVPSFEGKINHVILTDGQFNPHFCTYSNSDDKMQEKSWNTFAERMTKRFSDEGFYLPRTCFWNMNHYTPGFPASGQMMGLTLAEGLSQGLLLNILGNAVSYTTNENGMKVANINPVQSFLKSIYRTDFDKITDIITRTKEKCFEDVDAFSRCSTFAKQYQ
jgi:hypothetical protein